MAASTSYGPRPWTFYVLATLFALFVVFLYGPMIAVLILSFQGPSASLVFPLREPSLMWFDELFNPRRVGDVAGAFNRLPFYPDDANQTFDFNFDIKGLVAIAPVDGQYLPTERPTPLADYSYLVIHGSHDGDVSTFMGLMQYNRIKYTKLTPEQILGSECVPDL